LCIGIAKKLASCGYGVFALDYPGFGLSEGLHCYISSFNNLVNDVIEHFSKIKGIISQIKSFTVSFKKLLFLKATK